MKQAQSGAGATRLLITMPWGIGDAIVVGLSAVDQIRRNDQDGDVEIDILWGKDLFDHITPDQLTDAIMSQL